MVCDRCHMKTGTPGPHFHNYDIFGGPWVPISWDFGDPQAYENGDPGPVILSRGAARLAEVVNGWESLTPDQQSIQCAK